MRVHLSWEIEPRLIAQRNAIHNSIFGVFVQDMLSLLCAKFECAVGTRSYLFPALLVSKAPDLLILPAIKLLLVALRGSNSILWGRWMFRVLRVRAPCFLVLRVGILLKEIITFRSCRIYWWAKLSVDVQFVISYGWCSTILIVSSGSSILFQSTWCSIEFLSYLDVFFFFVLDERAN